MKTAVSHSVQLKPSMRVLSRQQSLAVYLWPAGFLTHASCATASLVAELMVALKEELISLHRPGDLKLLPRALDDADPNLMGLCPKAQRNSAKQTVTVVFISVLL